MLKAFCLAGSMQELLRSVSMSTTNYHRLEATFKVSSGTPKPGQINSEVNENGEFMS